METRPYLRVRRGLSPLERRAIDAHVARLSLRVCRETRTVLDAGRARGGFEALKRAAEAAGNARVLGLEALANLRTKRSFATSLGIVPSREDEARDELARSSGTMVRAAKGLRALCERYLLMREFDRRHLMAVAREMMAAVESFEDALDGALGYASPGDLEQLYRAYQIHLEACGQYDEIFTELVQAAFPRTIEERPVIWLGKQSTPDVDPLEEPSQRALTSMRTMVSYGELFVRREASHLMPARKAPARWISDSSSSLPPT